MERRAVLCAVAVACAAVRLTGQTKPPDLTVDALLKATQAYVAGYEKEFAYLLADETYEQAVHAADGSPAQSRSIHGELFLTYLAAERHWMSVHDFADVDGQPVPDHEDLRALLDRSPLGPTAQRLAARNARYNIGGFVRTFNEPTVALMPFEADRAASFRFTRGDVDRSDPAVTLVTLRFREVDDSTIIHTVGNRAVPSSGEILVEAATGRIRRATIGVKGQITAQLETTFAPDEKVGMWVPVRFTERYTIGSGRDQQVTTCNSTYTNYRRFDVTVRIK